MSKRTFQITITMVEGMYLHAEGGRLSDSAGVALAFGNLVPSGMPYFAINRGPNKGYYGCDVKALQTQMEQLIDGEIVASEEE